MCTCTSLVSCVTIQFHLLPMKIFSLSSKRYRIKTTLVTELMIRNGHLESSLAKLQII